MRNYTEQQLQENYEKFLNFIRKAFANQPERMEKLLHMYSAEELGMELLVAPASGRAHFHSAYIGGYIEKDFLPVIQIGLDRAFRSLSAERKAR